MSKKSKGKEPKAHPFGPPEERARGYSLPPGNPTLFSYADKSAASLPENLQQVFAAVKEHKDGVALKSLKVAKLSPKTLNWLVRQLAKHEYIRVKAAEKPEPKAKPKPKPNAKIG